MIAAFCLAACGSNGQRSECRKPLIGLSSEVGELKISLNRTYVNAVKAAGGIPVIIPATDDTAQVAEILSRVDGLIMTGGEDVAPAIYGAQEHENLGEVNSYRDSFDLALIEEAVRAGIPILGICRGEQVINVAFGGTLWQDIPSQMLDSKVSHGGNSREEPYHHNIILKKGSLIANLLEDVASDAVAVNSFHHQCVENLAPGFKIGAWAEDGVVEVIECFPPTKTKLGVLSAPVLGVQFHPEVLISTHNKMAYLPVVEWIVEESAKRAEYYFSK